MKPRRVSLILEVDTDVPLETLRRVTNYYLQVQLGAPNKPFMFINVLQAQANVVEPWDVKEATHASHR